MGAKLVQDSFWVLAFAGGKGIAYRNVEIRSISSNVWSFLFAIETPVVSLR